MECVPYRARLTAVLLASLALAATPVNAKRRPPSCAGGVFVLAGTPLTLGASTTRLATIAIGGGRVVLSDQCSGPVRLRGTKQGTTTQKAAVPGCPGIKGKVNVSGTLDAACGAFSGVLKAKKVPRTPVNATLTRCGDDASLAWTQVAVGSRLARSRASSGASGDGPRLYNGKRLPERDVLVRRVQIVETKGGGRQLAMLDEEPQPVRMRRREPGTFTKQVRSADQVVFPLTPLLPMPDGAP